MSKAKASFKGFFFFFIIAGLITGVVLLIMYWPQRPVEIKGSIHDQKVSIYNDESEYMTTFETFGEYTTNIRANAENAPLQYSYLTVSNLNSAFDVYFDFVSYAYTNADFSTFDKVAFQKVESGLDEAKSNLNKMSSFLKEKNNALTKDGYNTRYYEEADAFLVWENIEGYVKVALNGYAQATEALASVYNENVNKGIYANDFAYLVMSGFGDYMYFFSSNSDKLGTYDYYVMSNHLLTYTNAYLSQGVEQRMIAKYLTSPALQENTAKLLDFEKLTGMSSLRSVCASWFVISTANKTVEQIQIINLGKAFYKGGFTA